MKPKLSIIIPAYNVEKYLHRCLNNIMKQSYRNIEVIIVNDCSTDNSARIINEYCRRDRRFISVDHERNYGLYRARLTGIEKATGDYIAFVDSDDYVSLDFYRELIQCAINEKCEIVAGNTIRDNGGNLSQYTFHKICFGKNKLTGAEVREAFFGQEGSIYAWHTVWNKIYSKELWNRCLPALSGIKGHLTMCEDIAFSSILFFKARSFKYINSSNSYYYCVNPDAATNSQHISYSSYCKKLQDVNHVFDFVESFLNANNAELDIIMHFERFRMRYYMIWKGIAEDNSFVKKADTINLLMHLRKNVEEPNEKYASFEMLESSCHRELEDIRKLISRKNTEVVSFDIFDTLISRQLWEPDDIFELMQGRFEELFPDYKNVEFKSFRKLAERNAREEASKKNHNIQDIVIDDIYRNLKIELRLQEEKVKVLQEYEENLEIRFSRQRKTAKSLYDYAKKLGKRIVLISDMYLNTATITAILEKNGYLGYERLFLSSQEKKLKASGLLFETVINELGVEPSKIVHIGDNVNSDVNAARRKNINAVHFPKSKDRFEDKIEKLPTNRLSDIADYASGYLTTNSKLYSSIGFRSMAALVANKLFDNPFASWNVNTDFDANPYIMGYYAVGMHLVGVTKWLLDIANRRGIKKICFLSRDGYLPLKAFDALKTFYNVDNIETCYVPCSRQSLMPWMIENVQGLYKLPVSPLSHTPLSILALLKNYYASIDLSTLTVMLKKSGFKPEIQFYSEEEYYRFIRWFEENLFNLELLEKEKRIVTKYYQDSIPADSLVFDMGYSGRIPYAMQKALQYPIVFAYIHYDKDTFFTKCRNGGLDVEVMYKFVPPNSDLIREVFLSEVGNSCIGLCEKDDQIVPTYGETALTYEEKFVQQKIMDGCIDFISDFIEAFVDFKNALFFEPLQVSLPFEGMIQASNNHDKNVLYVVRSNDKIYGAQESINMADFWREQLEGGIFETSMEKILSGNNKLYKFAFLWAFDRRTLKQKVKVKLKKHKMANTLITKTYKTGKNLRNALKR